MGIPSNENKNISSKVSKCFGVLVSSCLGFSVYWFLGFLVQRFEVPEMQRFKDSKSHLMFFGSYSSHITQFPSCFLDDIDLIFKILENW